LNRFLAGNHCEDSVLTGYRFSWKVVWQRPVTLTAVPYYAWANREPGAMTAWSDEAPVKVSPRTE
jgi:DUF1680 family protein